MTKKYHIFFLSEVLLIGLTAKCLSLVSKIIMTRELGIEAMSLFALVNPLILLLLTLSSLSLQSAISSVISKKPLYRKKILKNALKITIIVSILLMIVLSIFSYFISTKLLKNIDTFPSIIASIFVIPLTSISSIIKGYFIGIDEIKLTSVSQIFEEMGRLFFIIILLTISNRYSPQVKASIAVFSLCIGEIFQILYMSLFYKNTTINKIHNFFKIKIENNNYTKEILKISLPMTLAKLIGSFTYFLEPIIFINIMSKNNFTNEIITLEYGILNSYALPLLLMPGFISITLSNILIPNLGRSIQEKNKNSAIKNIMKISLLCFIIGFFISLTFSLFSNQITTLIYGKAYGEKILKNYSMFFIIYYLETPLITSLNLFSLASKALLSTIISSIIRLILSMVLINFYYLDGLIIAIIISTYINVILNLFFLIRFFIRNNNNFAFK